MRLSRLRRTLIGSAPSAGGDGPGPGKPRANRLKSLRQTDPVTGGEPDAEHGRGGGDRQPGAECGWPWRGRSSASRSSESSIVPPSSSSVGPVGGRGCRQASSASLELARQVGAQPAQRAGAVADRPGGGGGGRAAVRVLARTSTRRASAPASRRRPRGRPRGPRPARAPCRRGCRRRRRARSAPAASVSRATPKSISFARGSPSSVTRTFCGLMSRWTTEREWAWSSASQRSAPISPISRSLSVAVAAELVEGGAVDQLGDEQRAAVLLPHLVEGDDPGVVEPAPPPAPRAGRGRSSSPPPGVDRLDRDRPLEAAVPGLVDRAEAAAADAALDQEAV